MDIYFAEATQFITALFVPVWIAIAVGVVAGIFVTRYGPLTKVWEKRLVIILATPLGLYVASFFISSMLLDHYAYKRLEAFAHERISLLVETKAKRVGIRDPNAIAELFSIICTAPPVSAHDSHLVDNITLFIPEAGYTYALGRDSEVEDEFWFDWLSYPGSEPDVVPIAKVKQFQSRALSDWLREHGLTIVGGKKAANQLDAMPKRRPEGAHSE